MLLQVKVLLLLVIANGVPILAWNILGRSYDLPLDGGLTLADGQPLFGSTKTVRGIVLSVIITSLLALAFGFSWKVGALIAVFAMLGDVSSSFIKRRIGLPPSSRAIGLDQIPECLFPLLAVQGLLDFSYRELVGMVAVFVLFDILFSPFLYKFNIRNRPY